MCSWAVAKSQVAVTGDRRPNLKKPEGSLCERGNTLKIDAATQLQFLDDFPAPSLVKTLGNSLLYRSALILVLLLHLLNWQSCIWFLPVLIQRQHTP